VLDQNPVLKHRDLGPVALLPHHHHPFDRLAAGEELRLADDRGAAPTSVAALTAPLPLGLQPGRALDRSNIVWFGRRARLADVHHGIGRLVGRRNLAARYHRAGTLSTPASAPTRCTARLAFSALGAGRLAVAVIGSRAAILQIGIGAVLRLGAFLGRSGAARLTGAALGGILSAARGLCLGLAGTCFAPDAGLPAPAPAASASARPGACSLRVSFTPVRGRPGGLARHRSGELWRLEDQDRRLERRGRHRLRRSAARRPPRPGTAFRGGLVTGSAWHGRNATDRGTLPRSAPRALAGGGLITR